MAVYIVSVVMIIAFKLYLYGIADYSTMRIFSRVGDSVVGNIGCAFSILRINL